MIGFGRSYVDVGSCDVFFRTRVLYVYGLGYTGLDRAWIWATAGQEKTNPRGQKYPSEIRLGGSTGAGLVGKILLDQDVMVVLKKNIMGCK